MPKVKDSVTVSPTTVRWGQWVSVSANSLLRGPWLRLTVTQDGIVVLRAFAKGLTGSFLIGETQAADEARTASGYVEVGSFGNRGEYRATGKSQPISVAP